MLVIPQGNTCKGISHINSNDIGSKACYIPRVFFSKRIFMLTELKVSSLACICVLYRPEHNAKGDPMDINFKGLETKK